MSLLMSEKQTEQKKFLLILVVWPCLLVLPTTLVVMLGSLIFGEFIFIEAIKGGIALQACILLLSAPFSLLPILLFLVIIFQNFKFVWLRATEIELHSIYSECIRCLTFYAILYTWHTFAVRLFNWSYHGELTLDLLDPISLTYFLISYPFIS
jgi:hypothetical protein